MFWFFYLNNSNENASIPISSSKVYKYILKFWTLLRNRGLKLICSFVSLNNFCQYNCGTIHSQILLIGRNNILPTNFQVSTLKNQEYYEKTSSFPWPIQIIYYNHCLHSTFQTIIVSTVHRLGTLTFRYKKSSKIWLPDRSSTKRQPLTARLNDWLGTRNFILKMGEKRIDACITSQWNSSGIKSENIY